MSNALFNSKPYFLTEQLFLERGRELLLYPEETVFPLDCVHFLLYFPCNNEAVAIHSKLLRRFTSSVEYIPRGQTRYVAHLLVDYFNALLLVPQQQLMEPFVLTPEISEDPNFVDESYFFGIALTAMQEYSGDFSREGLEFIRVYMRSALIKNARLYPKKTSSPERIVRPLYDGLLEIMKTLVLCERLSSHPALLLAISEHLINPDHVVDYLNQLVDDNTLCGPPVPIGLHLISSFENQCLHKHNKYDYERFLQYSALGIFIYALQPILLDSSWRPTHSSFDIVFWTVHESLRIENKVKLRKNSSVSTRELYLKQQTVEWHNMRRRDEQREQNILRIMTQKDAAPLPRILTFVADQSADTHLMLEEFFPLSIAGSEAYSVLPLLVSLTERSSSKKARELTQLLTRFHPDITLFLMMFFSVPRSSKTIYSSCAWALESFNLVLNKNASPDTVELPELDD